MQNYYEIRPSSSQCFLQLAIYGLAVTAIYYCLEPVWLMAAVLAAICLLSVYESRCLIRQDIIKLSLNPASKTIELRQGEQPYFYSKYKVHQTRWFAILNLVDADNSRTLILNPDCFNSPEAYQQLRFQLRRMEQANAA